MMTLGSVLDVMRAVAGIRERRELLDTLINAMRTLIPADWYLTAVRRGRDADEVDTYSCPEIAGLSTRVRDYAFHDRIALTGHAERVCFADIADLPAHAEIWRRVGVN